MGKALRDYFYISTAGKLKLYSKDDAEILITGANNHLMNLPKRSLVQINLDHFVFECMDEYFESGVNDDLLNKLNKHMEGIRHQCLVEKSHKKLLAVHIAHIPINPPPTIFASYLFSHITSLGGLEGLKRCQSPECQQFFIGRSNVKWCSKTCGSRSRVKKMRKKNRSR